VPQGGALPPVDDHADPHAHDCADENASTAPSYAFTLSMTAADEDFELFAGCARPHPLATPAVVVGLGAHRQAPDIVTSRITSVTRRRTMGNHSMSLPIATNGRAAAVGSVDAIAEPAPPARPSVPLAMTCAFGARREIAADGIDTRVQPR